MATIIEEQCDSQTAPGQKQTSAVRSESQSGALRVSEYSYFKPARAGRMTTQVQGS